MLSARLARRIGCGLGVLILSVLGLNGEASEPPRIRISEALCVGSTAFIGHVLTEREVAGSESEVRVEIRVRVKECLFGACGAGQELVISAIAASLEDTELGVKVPVASDVLVITTGERFSSNGRYEWDSNLVGGIDLLYFSAPQPRGWTGDGRVVLWSAYSDDSERVSWQEVHDWGKAAISRTCDSQRARFFRRAKSHEEVPKR